MTIEERLEKLAERHEAMALNLELMQRHFEDRFSKVTQTFEIALDAIKRLEVIAAAHEQRPDDLEEH